MTRRGFLGGLFSLPLIAKLGGSAEAKVSPPRESMDYGEGWENPPDYPLMNYFETPKGFGWSTRMEDGVVRVAAYEHGIDEEWAFKRASLSMRKAWSKIRLPIEAVKK